MGKLKELQTFIKENLFRYTDDFIEELTTNFDISKKDIIVSAENNQITLYMPIGNVTLSIEMVTE